MKVSFKIDYHPQNFVLWFILGFLLKFIVIAFLTYNLGLWENKQEYPFLFGGDAPMYLKTSYNIINHKIYALYGDPQNGFQIYTGRMPGYEVILILFTYFFKLEIALYAVIITQILFSIISIYCLAYIAKYIFNSNFAFYTTFFLYGINTYVTVFDISILTESLAVSTFIISFYLIVKPNSTKASYLLAGLLLCWSIFLRQYIAPFLLLFVIYINVKHYFYNNKSIKTSLITAFWIAIPFIIIDSAWITRNYMAKGKIIPLVDDLHAGYNYPQRFKFLMSFVQSWGGDLVHWNPKAEIVPFINSGISHLSKNYNGINDLPNYIYTSKYNIDSLKLLQKNYQNLEANLLSETEKVKLNASVISSLKIFEESFKEEKPLYYFIYARIRLLYKFLVHSGTYNISNKPISEQTLLQKLYKFFYTVLYWFVLLGGLLGSIMLVKNRVKIEMLLVVLCAFYMVLLSPLVLRRIEYRYFVLSYPFFTLIFGQLLHRVISRYYAYNKLTN